MALVDTVFGNTESAKIFSLLHAQIHKTIQDAITQTYGEAPQFYPLDPLGDMQDWLLMHDQMHKSISTILGISSPVGLDRVLLGNDQSFYDWEVTHDLAHANISAVLGV